MSIPKRTRSHEYPCTDCGGDAFVGFSGWIGPSGNVIGEEERICPSCAKKRGIGNPLETIKSWEPQIWDSTKGKK